MEIPMVKLKDYKLRSSGTAHGQIVQIPVNVVRGWGIQPGDMVEMFQTTEGDLVIRPANKKYIHEGEGCTSHGEK